MSFWTRIVAVLLISAAAYGGTPGTFRGLLYPGRNTKPGWVYIVGRNDTLRLVHIANASVTYAEEFPARLRREMPARSLRPGVDVRITAEQDSNGNWEASEVEIIALKAHEAERDAQPESPTRPELQTRKN